MKPIIFSGPMVLAILEGRKTQTRRVIKGGRSFPISRRYRTKIHRSRAGMVLEGVTLDSGELLKCPYGQVGDRLWVREKFIILRARPIQNSHNLTTADLIYKADHTELSVQLDSSVFKATKAGKGKKAAPSIHMPRWASRITLEITNVRAERAHNMIVENVIAEGVVSRETVEKNIRTYPLELEVNRSEYYTPWTKLWDSLNAKRGYSWDSNPWVWVLEFEVVDE